MPQSTKLSYQQPGALGGVYPNDTVKEIELPGPSQSSWVKWRTQNERTIAAPHTGFVINGLYPANIGRDGASTNVQPLDSGSYVLEHNLDCGESQIAWSQATKDGSKPPRRAISTRTHDARNIAYATVSNGSRAMVIPLPRGVNEFHLTLDDTKDEDEQIQGEMRLREGETATAPYLKAQLFRIQGGKVTELGG